MSHRRRDSDSRHHHRSRFDREPSPKRVRRDGKIATEKPFSNHNLDSADHTDRDEKHRRRMLDSPTRESQMKTDSKTECKESDKKSNGDREGTKNSSHNSEAPRSRSNYQHDERAGPVGRNFRHRETTERGSWKDSKERESGRAANRTSNNGDTKPRNEVESDLKQSSNKRRSFRETKIPVDDKSATEGTKLPVNGERSERKEERGKPQEKPPVDRHDRHRTEMQRTNYQSRDRYGGGGGGGGDGGSFRGRDRFNGRQGHSGGQADKWKHDLYHEANKSPKSKNEDDQIAKVEALLAS